MPTPARPPAVTPLRRLSVRLLLAVVLALVSALLPTISGASAADTGDPQADRQWNLDAIQVPEAWARSRGAGAVVAVIDSGITPGPDLQCRRFVAEYDATDGSSGQVQDASGHGTHIAGIIGQCSGNGRGTAGVAPDVTLMDVRALDAAPGAAQGSTGAVADGIIHATDAGADVINISLTMPCPPERPDHDAGCSTLDVDAAIQYAVARDVLLVAAAGNDGSDRVGYPATHPDVMAVGAVDASRRTPGYATTGDALDVVAPGGVNADTDGNGEADGIFQEWYDTASGTHRIRGLFGSSQAAAHVSGVAGLLRAAAPGASARQVRAAIDDSACDLGPGGYDTTYGHGLVRAADALAALLDGAAGGSCDDDGGSADTGSETTDDGGHSPSTGGDGSTADDGGGHSPSTPDDDGSAHDPATDEGGSSSTPAPSPSPAASPSPTPTPTPSPTPAPTPSLTPAPDGTTGRKGGCGRPR